MALDQATRGSKMTTIQAVIINRENDIIGFLDADIGKEVEVAGAIALDGCPVNRKTYRVSSSKANLEKALRTDAEFATRHEHSGFVFYTLNAQT